MAAGAGRMQSKENSLKINLSDKKMQMQRQSVDLNSKSFKRLYQIPSMQLPDGKSLKPPSFSKISARKVFGGAMMDFSAERHSRSLSSDSTNERQLLQQTGITSDAGLGRNYRNDTSMKESPGKLVLSMQRSSS